MRPDPVLNLTGLPVNPCALILKNIRGHDLKRVDTELPCNCNFQSAKFPSIKGMRCRSSVVCMTGSLSHLDRSAIERRCAQRRRSNQYLRRCCRSNVSFAIFVSKDGTGIAHCGLRFAHRLGFCHRRADLSVFLNLLATLVEFEG